MAHIVVEATPLLGKSLSFPPLSAEIHRRNSMEGIAAKGVAILDDLKSRAYVIDKYLIGIDPSAE